MTEVSCARWYEEPLVPTTRRRRRWRSLADILTYPVYMAGLDMHAERASGSGYAGEEVGCEAARQCNVAASGIDGDSRAAGVLEAGYW
jgi:hypothetical protein